MFPMFCPIVPKYLRADAKLAFQCWHSVSLIVLVDFMHYVRKKLTLYKYIPIYDSALIVYSGIYVFL